MNVMATVRRARRMKSALVSDISLAFARSILAEVGPTAKPSTWYERWLG
jgi:hypothetical protein